MKQNLAYYKARTNSETFRAVTLHCVSTPIESYKAKLQRSISFFVLALEHFRQGFWGSKHSVILRLVLLAAYHKLKFSEVINN